MVTKAKPKTREEKLAERRAELDYFAQVELQRVEQRAAHQAETDAFLQRVTAYHEQRAAALERGEELEPPVIPTLNGLYSAQAEAERAAEAEAEAARIAAIPARDTLISTLPYQKQMAIKTWENTRKQEFPLEALPYL